VPDIGPVFVSFYRAEQEGVDGYPVGEKSTRGSGMLTVKEDDATTWNEMLFRWWEWGVVGRLVMSPARVLSVFNGKS